MDSRESHAGAGVVAANGSAVTRALSRNALASMIGKVVYLASRVALPPIILRYLSLEEYGIWACSFILISYLGMGAFGISNVYVRYIAEYHARGEMQRINRLISTGLALTTGLGCMLLVALWWVLPAVLPMLRIPPHLQERAFIIVFAACAAFMLELSFGAFGQVLVGLHRLAAQTVVWVATSALEAGLIIVLLACGAGVYGLVAAFAARLGISVAVSAVLCVRALPGLSIAPRHFDRQCLRLFYGYGAIVQLSGLLGIVLYSIEKLIAGVFLGIGATGLFDVGEKFAVMVSGIPGSLNAALLPAISHLHGTDARDRAHKLYLPAARYVSLVGGLLMAFLAAFAEPVIVTWLGPAAEYRDAVLILGIFSLAFHMHVVTGPASAMYRGIGAPARELVYPLVQLSLIVISVPIGFAVIGRTVPVVAVTVAASMVVSAACYEAYTNHHVGVGQREFFLEVWLPGLLPYAIGFAAAALLRAAMGTPLHDRMQATLMLVAGGTLYAPISMFVLYTVCHHQERAAVLGAVRQLLPRRP